MNNVELAWQEACTANDDEWKMSIFVVAEFAGCTTQEMRDFMKTRKPKPLPARLRRTPLQCIKDMLKGSTRPDGFR